MNKEIERIKLIFIVIFFLCLMLVAIFLNKMEHQNTVNEIFNQYNIDMLKIKDE